MPHVGYHKDLVSTVSGLTILALCSASGSFPD